MLQAELKILGGKHQGKLIPLNTKKFLVGREQDCHLRPNSDLVSRHHCVFSIDDYTVRLRDLGSTNGTMVNGTLVRGEVLLKAGDHVTIGKLELEVAIRQSSGKSNPPSSASNLPTAPASSPSLSTAEIPTSSEDVDTSYELPAFAPPPSTIEVAVAAPADTAIIGATDPQMQPPGFAGYPPQGYPQMMPAGYPMPGAYMPPQYPQYPPSYGQMPGYGQPMGYPPMGYPQMMPMQQGYPSAAAVAAPVAAPVEPEPAPSSSQLAVRLPNPEETGVKPAAAPAPAAPGAAPPKKEEKPSTSAADIIKQYMSRRG
ncbi:FHA domain-containing protein [Schlesneria paludicola]|uniref:FHA domain-containing protein n=1 Tax=Schlesneria paludicola TaxID=360056 RepID=UPI00029A3D34|nr:FHA domain-containing protein [Schlesneria paludicola]